LINKNARFLINTARITLSNFKIQYSGATIPIEYMSFYKRTISYDFEGEDILWDFSYSANGVSYEKRVEPSEAKFLFNYYLNAHPKVVNIEFSCIFDDYDKVPLQLLNIVDFKSGENFTTVFDSSLINKLKCLNAYAIIFCSFFICSTPKLARIKMK
jgi:hypothetical protein